MKKTIIFICILCFGGFLFLHATPEITPDEIVEKADEVRHPSGSYFIKVEVTNTNKQERNHLFHVAIKDNKKTRIETIKPATSKGRNLLMIGDNMWAYVPSLGRAVRVGINQKISGEAVNSDISRMRWTGDYYAKIEKETGSEWQILLTSKKRGLTYDKIRLWIEKFSFNPSRAEYLTIGEKVLKNVTFKDYRYLAQKVRPGKIIIQDAVRKNDQSVIKILKMEKREFPEVLFNKDHIGEQRLKG